LCSLDFEVFHEKLERLFGVLLHRFVARLILSLKRIYDLKNNTDDDKDYGAGDATVVKKFVSIKREALNFPSKASCLRKQLTFERKCSASLLILINFLTTVASPAP